jgi:hypothetical protein
MTATCGTMGGGSRRAPPVPVAPVGAGDDDILVVGGGD